MRNKFPIFSIIMILIWLLPSVLPIFEGSNNADFTIDTYNADITIDELGDITVQESFVFDFPSDNSYSERWRDIGFYKNNPYSSIDKAAFDTSSVSVNVYKNETLLTQGIDYQFRTSYNNETDKYHEPVECYNGASNCESLYIWVPSGFSKNMRFDYTYKIEGAVTEYNDIAELNWILYDQLETKINNSTVRIHISNAKKEELEAYGYGTEGNIEISDNLITLTMSDINTNELIEFRLLMPERLFNVRTRNLVSENAYSKIKGVITRTQLFSSLIYYGMYVIGIIMILVTFYVYKKYDKEHTPIFQGKYYRELPSSITPAEMSYLYYFRKINDEDVTATLLDLVRRKFLIMDNNGSGINDKNPDFLIKLNRESDFNALLPHETQLIDWFIRVVGDDNQVSLKQIENYTKTSYQNAMRFNEEAKEFVRKAKVTGSKHDFFETNADKSKAYAWILIPIVYAIFSLFAGRTYGVASTYPIIVAVVVSILYIAYVSSIKKRSINGNEEYVKWKAFKEFLLDFSNMKDYPMPGIVIWEHYLVYATSLKVADKVMQQLEVKLPNVDEAELSNATYMGYYNTHLGFYYGYALGRINRTMLTAKQNGATTIANYHAAQVSKGSGFGGGRGGGFGGGRSFGGGGGGGRIR